MSLLAYLVVLALVGLLVGALARLALPGPDPMSIPATIALGLGGTFLAGIAMRLLFHSAGPGLVVSIAFSTLILWGIRRAHGRGVRPFNSRRW